MIPTSTSSTTSASWRSWPPQPTPRSQSRWRGSSRGRSTARALCGRSTSFRGSRPGTSFNGRVSPHRRFAFGQLSLEEVKAIKNEHGVTVNDVVVTLCAGAVRRWLIEHKELPDSPLVAQIPVSVRTDEQFGTYGNK